MLEDKGISLEGKRCLITGSDSVSTVRASDFSHVVHLILSISYSISFLSILIKSSSFSTSPFLSFLFLILPSFFSFLFLPTYLPTYLPTLLRFFVSSSLPLFFLSLLPSFFSSYLLSFLLSILFSSCFFSSYLTSFLLSLLFFSHFSAYLASCRRL